MRESSVYEIKTHITYHILEANEPRLFREVKVRVRWQRDRAYQEGALSLC